MDEKIIKASSGNYGRIYIVVPISVKESMMAWMKKSGFKKAHFFRTALMIGTIQLAQQLGIRGESDNHFYCDAQQDARR
jgi:hypothetical protein